MTQKSKWTTARLPSTEESLSPARWSNTKKGALISLITYEEGVEDGPVKEWYMDGALSFEGMMPGGFPVGELRRWHPNGRPAAVMVMSTDGLRRLAITEWDEAGALTREWRAERD